VGSSQGRFHAEPDRSHGKTFVGERSNGMMRVLRKRVEFGNQDDEHRKGGFMKKDRLEWVMSGLNQYNLTKTEDQFIKTALQDFDKNQALTEHQEEKLESLYKEKSKLTPNKKSSSYFTFAETIPKKTKARRPRPKNVF
jgi:superfamily II DNA helicase RecQ